jgi:Spy/CpxP family protein refolding chaperone
MFGLVVGTLCLCGLFATLRRRHYLRFADFYGYHWGHHHGHHYGHGHWQHRGHGPGACHGGPQGQVGWGGRRHRRGNVLHFLFAELDTTPGQEKAIMLALDALREARGAVRKELLAARKDLAELMAADVLDGAALDTLLQRQQEHLGKFAHMLRDFVALVHEALNPAQRKTLAGLVADGSLAALFRGQHRDHHHHESY